MSCQHHEPTPAARLHLSRGAKVPSEARTSTCDTDKALERKGCAGCDATLGCSDMGHASERRFGSTACLQQSFVQLVRKEVATTRRCTGPSCPGSRERPSLKQGCSLSIHRNSGSTEARPPKAGAFAESSSAQAAARGRLSAQKDPGAAARPRTQGRTRTPEDQHLLLLRKVHSGVVVARWWSSSLYRRL